MIQRFFHPCVTAIYASLLIAVYILEISDKWSYMGFQQIESVLPALVAIIAVVFFSIFVPYHFDTRSFLLAVTHYSFLVPAFIVLAAAKFNPEYFGALLLVYLLLFSVSTLPLKPFRIPHPTKRFFFFLIIFLLILSAILMAGYGGLNSFNLNIFRVYEFRREAAVAMPEIFGYIFSGVSKVIAPMSLALALYFRNQFLFCISAFFIIMLFGMTHHKSVLILPFVVAIFYLALKRTYNLRVISYIFLGVSLIAISEIFYLHMVDFSGTGSFNTVIVRRAFFVPPLLDTLYIDFFSNHEKIYWSTSKLGLGIASNPYDLTAPFIIGREAFGREEMSANTGIIGSGFSHAGYIGVALYAGISGLFISFLQAYGKTIGHALVSAGSLSIFLAVVTSTDFATAILTHGLLLLVVLLMIFPKKKNGNGNFSRNANDHSLYHRPPAH